jgi:hypothetical protein
MGARAQTRRNAAVTPAAAGARRRGRAGGGGRGRGGGRGAGAGAGAGAAARVARPPRAGDGPRGGRLRRAAGERGRGPQRARVGRGRLLLHTRLPRAPVRGPWLLKPCTSPTRLRSRPLLSKRLLQGSEAKWGDKRGRGFGTDVTEHFNRSLSIAQAGCAHLVYGLAHVSPRALAMFGPACEI